MKNSRRKTYYNINLQKKYLNLSIECSPWQCRSQDFFQEGIILCGNRLCRFRKHENAPWIRVITEYVEGSISLGSKNFFWSIQKNCQRRTLIEEPNIILYVKFLAILFLLKHYPLSHIYGRRIVKNIRVPLCFFNFSKNSIFLSLPSHQCLLYKFQLDLIQLDITQLDLTQVKWSWNFWEKF